MKARASASPIRDERTMLDAFEGIRRAQFNGRYAPHKPLLLLLALSRVQRAAPRMARFTEIEPELRTLLIEFGPSHSASKGNFPFWHLGTDHQGALWQLEGPPAVLERPAGATPNLGELRAHDVRGGFSREVYGLLTRNPTLLRDVAGRVLRAFFPASIHDDIIAAVGLDLEAHGEAATPDAGARRRDPGFREKVLRAYELRCCVCGFDLRIGSLPAGLEAAHIQWHHVGGPDVVPNGLALCSLHHKLFDLGVFTIEETERRVVFSQHAIDGARGLAGELRHHGQPMLPPQDPAYAPDRRFLAWNWSNVFKRPERRLAVASP